MSPFIFYRVEDENSRAQHVDGRGILAEDTRTQVNFGHRSPKLFDEVARHLEWGNKRPTPFISVYSSEEVAHIEGMRRVETGKKDVKVYKINVRQARQRIEYRDIRLLAKNLKLYIPEHAWHNSEYEYIFLHRIPPSAIVGCSDPEPSSAW